MNVYFDSDMDCIIYLKDRKKKMIVKWSYLKTKLIDELYNEYGNKWDYFEVYYSDTGNPYGKIYNTKKVLNQRFKELKKTDFDSIVIYDFLIICELFLKSDPENPRLYKVTKEELLNKFVIEMNNLHGKDWVFFNTFFHDTGDVAYGSIKNDINLRKNNKLTWNGLKLRRYRVNKEKWKNELNKREEIFYVLKFTNADFIKIGHTFRDIEYRLYNYIFAKSIKEKKLYSNKIIDFKSSFFIKANIIKQDVDSKLKESLESIVKKEFKGYRFEDKKYGESNEILKEDSYSKIQEYFVNNEKYKIISLSEYTGFENSIEMKDYNIKQGIRDNVLSFYTKKNKPVIYLKK